MQVLQMMKRLKLLKKRNVTRVSCFISIFKFEFHENILTRCQWKFNQDNFFYKIILLFSIPGLQESWEGNNWGHWPMQVPTCQLSTWRKPVKSWCRAWTCHSTKVNIFEIFTFILFTYIIWYDFVLFHFCLNFLYFLAPYNKSQSQKFYIFLAPYNKSGSK